MTDQLGIELKLVGPVMFPHSLYYSTVIANENGLSHLYVLFDKKLSEERELINAKDKSQIGYIEFEGEYHSNTVQCTDFSPFRSLDGQDIISKLYKKDIALKILKKVAYDMYSMFGGGFKIQHDYDAHDTNGEKKLSDAGINASEIYGITNYLLSLNKIVAGFKRYHITSIDEDILVPDSVLDCTKQSLLYSDKRDYTNLNWESFELSSDDGTNPFLSMRFPIERIPDSEFFQQLEFKDRKDLENLVKKIDEEPNPTMVLIEHEKFCDINGAVSVPYYQHGLFNMLVDYYGGEVPGGIQKNVEFLKKHIFDMMVLNSALCCYTPEMIEKSEDLNRLYQMTTNAVDVMNKNFQKTYDQVKLETLRFFRNHFNDGGPFKDNDIDVNSQVPVNIEIKPSPN